MHEEHNHLPYKKTAASWRPERLDMRCTEKGLGGKGQRSPGHYGNHLVPWRKEEEGRQNRGMLTSFRVVLALSWVREKVWASVLLSWPTTLMAACWILLGLRGFTALGIYSPQLPRLSWDPTIQTQENPFCKAPQSWSVGLQILQMVLSSG